MVEELTPTELAARLQRNPGEVVLLDVRESWERDLAVIDPSVHIPMNEIADRNGELPPDRAIVVYCHGGTRSAMVASYLEHHGFASVANLTGGIEEWSLTVDPKVPRYR
ncbi:MAG: sulfurtransferase [Thermoplasmata archaeon]|nr:sulfurtransferase [Thermoplasmata archaeon]